MKEHDIILHNGEGIGYCIKCKISTVHKALSKERLPMDLAAYTLQCKKCNYIYYVESINNLLIDFSSKYVIEGTNTYKDRDTIRCCDCHSECCECDKHKYLRKRLDARK